MTIQDFRSTGAHVRFGPKGTILENVQQSVFQSYRFNIDGSIIQARLDVVVTKGTLVIDALLSEEDLVELINQLPLLRTRKFDGYSLAVLSDKTQVDFDFL